MRETCTIKLDRLLSALRTRYGHLGLASRNGGDITTRQLQRDHYAETSSSGIGDSSREDETGVLSRIGGLGSFSNLLSVELDQYKGNELQKRLKIGIIE